MAVRDIVVWPDSRLREKCRDIGEITDEIRALYRDMTDTMYAQNGLGLAAIQIGVPLNMFLVEPRLAGRDEKDGPLAFINPEIVETGGGTERSEEGCLSFPDIYVPVERPLQAKFRAKGIDGETFEVDGEGLLARCMLHENDHLCGRLLVDYVGPLKRQMIKRRLKRAAAQQDKGDDAGEGDAAASR